ncbi:biotin-dependent carboxyltransferase family protein [Microaerobacter geothermalis]|uniref:5-oxoprolinase subunit C family protein n=1 Tax=Microaerobacter geothermalis TaxID=674972 RepID=UPI001F1F3408|nr:biotin-dependent carboxyltransferase family protein [Microaerobacter geothermalis]MCF6095063.1 biotin-dependent carboxyltransferase family protein [Microaerobacter geothermalis]
MIKAFEVINPGLLTTVQDLGRYGFQQYGMVAAGAMDSFALQVSNLLVGNPRNEAGLEITMVGPALKALDDLVIALCGADLSPTIEGKKVPLWKSFLIRKGQELRFHAPVQGARTYLAIAGGIAVEKVMGSKSTYLKASIGGYQGRALKKGDVIEAGPVSSDLSRLTGRGLSPGDIPHYGKHVTVRVVLGPQEDAFTPEGLDAYLSGIYEVTPQSDRMGYRLKGPVIQHKETADIISDAIAPGSIQVPSNGQPIILLADRQTTGGYTKIATVITVDLPLIAQLLPGNTLSFQAIEVEEAQNLYIQQEQLLSKLQIAAGAY